jgi:hypothetical protein
MLPEESRQKTLLKPFKNLLVVVHVKAFNTKHHWLPSRSTSMTTCQVRHQPGSSVEASSLLSLLSLPSPTVYYHCIFFIRAILVISPKLTTISKRLSEHLISTYHISYTHTPSIVLTAGRSPYHPLPSPITYPACSTLPTSPSPSLQPIPPHKYTHTL